MTNASASVKMALANPLETRVFIGLGSNLQNPVEQLNRALAAIEHIPQSRLVVVSPFYETEPVGKLDQPVFINAVAELATTLTATTLLGYLLAIEAAQQRVRIEKNGPRTLDLDILLFGDERMVKPGLTVPHPRLHERAFALVPLVDIAPGIVIPGVGLAKACLSLLGTTPDSIRRIEEMAT